MKHLYLLFILFVFLCSCSFNKSETLSNNSSQILSLSDNIVNESCFKNYFELDEIIPIPTNDSILISDIRKVIRFDDKIILFSKGTNHVLIIDANKGVVEQDIIRKGRGPGESRSILDITFHEEFEQIIIHNDYNRLLFYDINGEFIFQEEVGSPYEGICIHKGEIILHNKMAGYSCYPYAFKIYNLQEKTWRQAGKNQKVDFHIRSQGLNLVKSKRLWFTSPLDYSLFTLENDQISTQFEFDIPKNKINSQLVKISISDPMAFFQKISENNLIYSINSIRETSNYIVFKSNQPGFFIIDKKVNKIYWDKSFVGQYLFPSAYYYPHDGDDNKIMFILPAQDFTQSGKLNLNDELDFSNIKESDNPILLFFKEKDRF